MSNESAKLRRELEGFKQSAAKLSEKINGVSEVWRDQNYAALHVQMGELAKSSKTVIDDGEKTCSCIEKFFSIAAESV